MMIQALVRPPDASAVGDDCLGAQKFDDAHATERRSRGLPATRGGTKRGREREDGERRG